MKNVLHFISTPVFQGSIALPMITWFLGTVYGLGWSPVDVLHGGTVRLFAVVLLISIAVSIHNAFRNKSYGKGLLWLGAGFVLLQGVSMSLFFFSGKIGIGKGEDAARYYEVVAGPWAKPPAIPLALVGVKTGPPLSAVVTVGGRERELLKGQEVSWNEYRLKLREISAAPLFVLDDSKGAELDGGYIKLVLPGTDPQYFQFPIIPHRFYVSLPGYETERWESIGRSWKRVPPDSKPEFAGVEPETIHLTVTRGKLRLASGVVRRGEPLGFDGFTITFDNSKPWIGFAVARSPAFMLAYCGLACIVAGALARFVMERSA